MTLDVLLSRFSRLKKLSDKSYLVPCPAHADKNPSLHVSEKEGKLLLKCQAGCSTDAVLQALNLSMSDLFVESQAQSKPIPKTIVATYDYKDEQGNLLYQKVRYEPKDFRLRHMVNGEWSNNLNGCRRVLYHLNYLKDLIDETVYYVEGEKDVESLGDNACFAVTAGGVNDWQPEFADALKGLKVVIIPDKDNPGYDLAKRVAKDLTGKAREVKVIILPGDGKDISDWLAERHEVSELTNLEQGVEILFQTYTFQNDATSYSFHWETEQIDVVVSRIRQHKDGRTTSRIIFSSQGTPVWQKDGFNLTACNNPLNRKELSNRVKKEVNWIEILEIISVKSIETFEQGEPVIQLSTSDQVERPPYLIKPFLTVGYPTIIFGDPSSGKTTLALAVGLISSVQWEDNPLGLQLSKRVNCLYLDWETGLDGIQWQLTSLKRGMELGNVSLKYRRCFQPLVDDLENIRMMVNDHDIGLVIIDSLGLACGGELKDTAPALSFFRALGQLKTTSLILAHTPKEKDNRTIYGNRFFEAESRSTWEIQKQQENDSDEMSIALFHQKPFPWDRKMQPVGFKVEFSEAGNGTIISPQDPKTIQEFIDRMGTQMRILALLKDGIKRTPKEIAEQLELKPGNIRVALYHLKKKGSVLKLGETYTLPAQQSDMGFQGVNGVND